MTIIKLILLSLCAATALCCGGGGGGSGGGDGESKQGCVAVECDFEEGEMCDQYMTYGCPAKPKRSQKEMNQYYSAIGSRKRARARARRDAELHMRLKRSSEEEGNDNGCPEDGEPVDPLLKSFVVTKVEHSWNNDGSSGNHHLAAALYPEEYAMVEVALEEELPADILIEMDTYVTSTDMEMTYCCGSACEDLKSSSEKWETKKLECNQGEQLISMTCTNAGKKPNVCAIDNVKVTAGIDCEEEGA